MATTYTHQFNSTAYTGSVTLKTGLFIGGDWVDAIVGESIDVVNPSTGTIIISVVAGDSKDVDRAVIAAQKAYKSAWGQKTPAAARGKLLFKLADLIERDAEAFAALESLNVGKPFMVARYVDVETAVKVIRFVAGAADKINGKTTETADTKLSYTRREPFGVVGLITPWNFPLVMAVSKMAPALAAGNTVVLKPSEVTPLSALKLCDLITEAGFPPGVVNVVNGYGHTVGQAISENMSIYKLSFTGSTAVGRKILKTAAESNLKKVTLELGGKSPLIVFDDADLDQAVKWASQGIFFNSGQVCNANSRIFVQERIYGTFLAKFTASAKELETHIGDPFAAGTRQGPLVSRTHFERVLGYVNAGKTDGATLHYGGEQHGQDGFFVQPTIFTDVKPNMKIATEEIFGPVASIFRFNTEEEAVELANDTSYGLASNIFTQNVTRAIRVSNALETGTTHINCAGLGDPSMPFGGYKQSGIGREFGEEGLYEYTQLKTVQINIGVTL